MTSAAVTAWMASAGIPEDDERVAVVTRFCAFVDGDPDELVASCLADAGDGQFKIKMKSRRLLTERINDFQKEVGDQRTANVVRSFFIHNGITMQPPGILR